MFIFHKLCYIKCQGEQMSKRKRQIPPSFNQILISDYYFNALDQLIGDASKIMSIN